MFRNHGSRVITAAPHNDPTTRMIDAFVPAGQERSDMHRLLRQIRTAAPCRCTTMASRQPVKGCRNCTGTGFGIELRHA